MRAATSGGLGDIVYSIPILKKLGVKTIYIKENYYFPPHGNLYLSAKTLMESQGFEVLPTSGQYGVHEFDPAIEFDYSLDEALKQPRRGVNHIIVSYINTFKIPPYNWKQPWLKVHGDSAYKNYSVIHLTPRWREHSKVNWLHVRKQIEGEVIFVGHQHEWIDFCQKYGNIYWAPTNDILELAIILHHAKAVYCNQSVSLALSQGLGKEYYCEFKPGKTNCRMFTENEHEL